MATRAFWATGALVTGLAVTSAVIMAPAEAAQDCASAPDASVNTELTERFGDYGDTAGRWTGADSAYSVRLPNGATAWLYSDTFLGEVDDAHGRPTDSPFIHNSIVVDDAGELSTFTGGSDDDPESLAKVKGGNEKQRWYWFGDGTVEGDQLRVMLLEFEKTGDGPLDFAFAGNAVASFDTDDMSLNGITQLPQSDVNWGSAVYEARGYTYVFGVEDNKDDKFAHLARVPSDSLTSSDWEYFADGKWSRDPAASTRILEGVSNEFSVSRFQGKFTLVAGDATEKLSDKIVMYRSKDIGGPYKDKKVLYETPETDGDVYTYNAKAHPQLGTGKRLLVTYNVNSLNGDDLYDDVDNYRPRYLDVYPNGGGSCPF